MMKRLLAEILAIGSLAVAALAQTAPIGGLPIAAPAPAQNPKKPGAIRIGIVQPRMDMGPAGANAGEALRVLLSQYLSGPTLEAVPLTAMLPIQAAAEGQQKQCDYILYATLSQKKSGGLGLLKSAQSMAGMVPMLGMTGRTGAIVGQAAAQTALSAAGQVASGVKAKSEVSFEYQIIAPGATSRLAADSEKTKAQSDGQDVITPMVEHAAMAIISAFAKR